MHVVTGLLGRKGKLTASAIVALPFLLGACDSVWELSGDKTEQPWNAKSKSLELTCSGFFDGAMRFRATREQLSANELRLLGDLAMVRPQPGCRGDGLTCKVAITQMDGKLMTYEAIEGDPACANLTSQVLSFASLDPFRRGLACRFSKRWKASDTPLLPEPRCLHGLYATPGTTLVVPLEVKEAGTRHVELDRCDGAGQLGKLAAEVRTPASPTPLATLVPVAASTDQACASVDHTFTQPGRYELWVNVDGTFSPAADLFLQYR